MITTIDFDTTVATRIEFAVRYGCNDFAINEWRKEHMILLQFSTTGGISWHLLTHIYYESSLNISYRLIKKF